MSTERPDDLDGPRGSDTPETRHPHGQAHGRPRSWLLVGALLAAFIVGGIALIAQTWWLFWVCVGVVLLGVLAGRFVGVMNDTVEWVTPLERSYQPQGHILLGDDSEKESGRRQD